MATRAPEPSPTSRPSDQASPPDDDAFARLYEAYADRVYRYLLSRTSSPVDAEELTSRTFLNALANLDGYRGGGGEIRVVADEHRPQPAGQLVPLAGPQATDGQPRRRNGSASEHAGARGEPRDKRGYPAGTKGSTAALGRPAAAAGAQIRRRCNQHGDRPTDGAHRGRNQGTAPPDAPPIARGSARAITVVRSGGDRPT